MADKACTRCGGDLKPKQRLRRGMCPNCYRRWVEDPNNRSTVRKMNRPVIDRIKEKSAVQPNGCIHWTANLNPNGYGTMSVNLAMRLVHRVLYQELHGPLPDDVMLDHTCHNKDLTCDGGPTCLHRRCVNPEHLEPVTNFENQVRSKNTPLGRRVLTGQCIHGHPYTSENTYINPQGYRSCRACHRLQQQEAREADEPTKIREFCRNGHRMTEDNTLIRGKYARCRRCAADIAQRARDRQKGRS